jgi:hypothetical protein
VAYWERMPGEMPETAPGALRKIRDAFARHGVAIEGHVVRCRVIQDSWLQPP